MPFSNSVTNYNINSGNSPLLYPVRVICAAGARTGISFPDQFLGRAISLKISNNDSANAASYDYNLNGQFQNPTTSSKEPRTKVISLTVLVCFFVTFPFLSIISSLILKSFCGTDFQHPINLQ